MPPQKNNTNVNDQLIVAGFNSKLCCSLFQGLLGQTVLLRLGSQTMMAVTQQEFTKNAVPRTTRSKERNQSRIRDRSINESMECIRVAHRTSVKNNHKRVERMSGSSRRDTMASSSRRDALGTSSKRDYRRRRPPSPSPPRNRNIVPMEIIVASSPRSVRDHVPVVPCKPPQQEPQEQPWSCTCGEENEGFHNFCGMCANPRTWQCAGCDFDNKCIFKFCGMCGISKTVKTEQDGENNEEEEDKSALVAPNEWKCKGCDNINPCPYNFCSMCGSCKVPGEESAYQQASFPPPFVTCRPENALEDSLRSFESWSGE
jgi:hypothetical protein